MNFKKLLIIPFTALLLGCNKQVNPFDPVTKQIADEVALTRSEEILSHQKSDDFFMPKKLKLVDKTRKLSEHKSLYETGYLDKVKEATHSFDLDNLIHMKKVTETVNGNAGDCRTDFHFWKDNIYYSLHSKNKGGQISEKYRTEKAMNKEEAQSKFEELLNDQANEFKKITFLRDFKDTMSDDQEYHQMAESNPEAKYDYRYGSNDINSLERTIDSSRTTHNVEDPEGTQYDFCEEIGKERLFLNNNLLKSEYRYNTEDYRNNSNDYYHSIHTEESVNASYSKNLKITLPSINDYPIKEE